MENILRELENIEIKKSALGNIAIIESPNGLDTNCYIVTKEGKIGAQEFIAWEDSAYLPTALQFLNWYECHRDRYSYIQAVEYEILIK